MVTIGGCIPGGPISFVFIRGAYWFVLGLSTLHSPQLLGGPMQWG